MVLHAEVMHRMLLFAPSSSKVAIGFLVSLYLWGSACAPTAHECSSIQFLCVLLFQERYVQLQALQHWRKGSLFPGLSQKELVVISGVNRLKSLRGQFLAWRQVWRGGPGLRKRPAWNNLGQETCVKSSIPGRYRMKLESIIRTDSHKLILNSTSLGN